jgi:RNA polymerase sigma-70 factor (ECF subfamily)
MRLTNAHRAAVPAFTGDGPSSNTVADADEACLRVFQEELDYVHRTLLRLGAGRPDVEDLMQDVFMALRGSWSRCDKSRPIRPYLFGIAFRIVAAHRRKRRREVPFGVVEPLDPNADLDDQLQRQQARRLILAALDHVPLRRRAVLIMHELDEVSVADVANALKIPRFTVYGRLRKARRELAAALRRMREEGR